MTNCIHIKNDDMFYKAKYTISVLLHQNVIIQFSVLHVVAL